MVAGLLLGLAPGLKIWGVVAVLVVVGGIVYRRGRRAGLTTLLASMASCAALCLPFFLAAPAQMWRMVVVAQVGRRRVDESEIERLTDVLGLRLWLSGPPRWTAGLTVLTLVALASLVVCVVRAELRVIAALLLTHGALVMTTPMWFLHYAGLTPAPLALALGGALASLLIGCGRRIRWLPPVVAQRCGPGCAGPGHSHGDVEPGRSTVPGPRASPRVSATDRAASRPICRWR